MKNEKLVVLSTSLVVLSTLFILFASASSADAYKPWRCCESFDQDDEVKTGDVEQHGKQNAATNQICIAFTCEQNLAVDQNYAKDKATIDSESGEYDSHGKYSVNIYIDYDKSASHYHGGLLTAEVAGKTYVPYHFDMGEAVKKADGKQIFYIYNFNPGVLEEGDTYKICVKNLDNGDKDCNEVDYHGSDGQNPVNLNFPS